MLFFRKKSQISLEFMILFVFMSVLLTLALYFIGHFIVDFNKQDLLLQREDVANSILNEFQLYGEVRGGYDREFVIESFIVEQYDIKVDTDIDALVFKDFDVDGGVDDYLYFLPQGVNYYAYKNQTTKNIHFILKKINIQNRDDLYLNSNEKNDIDCTKIPYGDWIHIKGNLDTNQDDFCVMKYEAKATTLTEVFLDNSLDMNCGDGTPGTCDTINVEITSKPQSKSLNMLTQNEARTLCTKLGNGFHLITNNEWVTISKELEKNEDNWINNLSGDGFLYLGHSDGSPAGLNASLNDLDGYYGTNDSTTSCDGYYSTKATIADETTQGITCLGQRRTLELNSGEIIWDFAGNYFEWTNDTFTTNFESSLGTGISGWESWENIPLTYSYLGSDLFKDSNQGIGQILLDIDDADPASDLSNHALMRGGAWGNGNTSGIYNLYLGRGPNFNSFFTGFRCTYSN